MELSKNSAIQALPAELSFNTDTGELHCVGEWVATHLQQLDLDFKQVQRQAQKITSINVKGITKLDSAGALVLHDFRLPIVGFTKQHQALFDLVATKVEASGQVPPKFERPNWFYRVGEMAVDKYCHAMAFLEYVGEVMVVLGKLIMQPWKLDWSAMCDAIDDTGYQAMPILALLTFLVGVVLAYQLGTQLSDYGADVFIVDVTGTAFFREFGPLMTAIILAARTSTSFAALLGTMKINEEIDALKTMGITPVARLVIPRLLGLLIAFPLLTIWADMFGILGAMVMSKNMFGITYHAFVARFQVDVSLNNYLLGLVKAPTFALIIAGVGCFQGLQVIGTSDSVGKQTTKAAVQAIFLIIVADAIYSVVFTWLGV